MCLCVRGCLPVNLNSGVVSFSYHSLPYLEDSSLKAFLTTLTEALCSPHSPLWSFFLLKPPDFIGLNGLASMLPPKRRLSSSSCLTFVQGPKVTKESQFLVILRALLKCHFPGSSDWPPNLKWVTLLLLLLNSAVPCSQHSSHYKLAVLYFGRS